METPRRRRQRNPKTARQSKGEQAHRPRTVPRAAVPNNTQPVIINQPPDVDASDFQVEDDSSTDDPAAEVPEPDPDPDPRPVEDPVPRGSLRERRHNPRFRGDDWVNTLHWRATGPSPEVAFALNLDWDFPSESDTLAYYDAMLFSSINIHDGTLYDYPPMLFAAKANDADSPSRHERS